MSLEPLVWTSYAFRLLIDQKMDVVFKCSRSSSLIRTRTQVIAGSEIAMHFAANVNAARDIDNHVSNDFLHLCVACEGIQCGRKTYIKQEQHIIADGDISDTAEPYRSFLQSLICFCKWRRHSTLDIKHICHFHINVGLKQFPTDIWIFILSLVLQPWKNRSIDQKLSECQQCKSSVFRSQRVSGVFASTASRFKGPHQNTHTHTQCDTKLHRVCTYLCLMRPSACHWGVCNPELRSEPVRATVAVLAKAGAGGKERTEEGRVVRGGKQRTYTGFVLLWW